MINEINPASTGEAAVWETAEQLETAEPGLGNYGYARSTTYRVIERCQHQMTVSGRLADVQHFWEKVCAPLPGKDPDEYTALDLHRVIPMPFTEVIAQSIAPEVYRAAYEVFYGNWGRVWNNSDSALGCWPGGTPRPASREALIELLTASSGMWRELWDAREDLRTKCEASSSDLISGDWALANWGVTLNTCEREGLRFSDDTRNGVVDEDAIMMECRFVTESSPPIPVLRKLAQDWPQLMIRVAYIVEEFGSGGVTLSRSGRFVHNETEDWARIELEEFGWTDSWDELAEAELKAQQDAQSETDSRAAEEICGPWDEVAEAEMKAARDSAFDRMRRG
jgi:hypothetical protein